MDCAEKVRSQFLSLHQVQLLPLPDSPGDFLQRAGARENSKRVARSFRPSYEAGHEAFRHACLMGLEGIVSKHKDQPYRAGR